MARSDSTDDSSGLLDDLLALYSTAEAETVADAAAVEIIDVRQPEAAAADMAFEHEIRQSLDAKPDVAIETPTVDLAAHEGDLASAPAPAPEPIAPEPNAAEPSQQPAYPPGAEAKRVQSDVRTLRSAPMSPMSGAASSPRAASALGERSGHSSNINVGALVGLGLLLLAAVLAVLLVFG